MRYLEQLEFGLVFEACQERRVLRKIAPHMVSALPFIMPVYQDSVRPYWLIRIGMWLYDFLALFRNVKLHKALSKASLLELEPMVSPDGLQGGPRFYDCQVDDARLTLATIQSAHRAGAVVVNHASVTGLVKAGGKVRGVQFRDELTGKEAEARSKIVAGAAGPWGDSLLKMDDPQTLDNLRPTKGVHLMVRRDRIGNCNALSYLVKRDARLMFLIPWGKFSIIGTTDTDYRGRPEDLTVEASDIDYTLDSFNRGLPHRQAHGERPAERLRGPAPLVAENAATESKVSREHRIFLPESGLITIGGGKLTTYRVMAKQVVDIAEKRLARDFATHARSGCVTDKLALEGGGGGGLHAGVAGHGGIGRRTAGDGPGRRPVPAGQLRHRVYPRARSGALRPGPEQAHLPHPALPLGRAAARRERRDGAVALRLYDPAHAHHLRGPQPGPGPGAGGGRADGRAAGLERRGAGEPDRGLPPRGGIDAQVAEAVGSTCMAESPRVERRGGLFARPACGAGGALAPSSHPDA